MIKLQPNQNYSIYGKATGLIKKGYYRKLLLEPILKKKNPL